MIAEQVILTCKNKLIKYVFLVKNQFTQTQQLDAYNAMPEFNNYLAYIFSSLKQVAVDLRQVAGLLLKTNLSKIVETIAPKSPQMLHIKQLLLDAISDPSPVIRNTASSCISVLVLGQGLKGWDDLLQKLVSLLSAKDSNVVDGAMNTLYKICEDNAKELDKEEFNRPVQFIIPTLVNFFTYPVDSVRRDALSAVLQFFPLWPNVLAANMEKILSGIFFLTKDQSKQVRKYVCSAFVMLVDHPEFLKPHFNNIAEYMISCTAETADEGFALDACEFWSALAEGNNRELLAALQPFLPKYVCFFLWAVLKKNVFRLVPVLLNAMVYSELERLYLEEETSRPDKDSDIAPHIHQPKIHVHDQKLGAQMSNYDDDDDEDEDYEDEDDNEFDSTNDWNLRKCSAASLDLFSDIYGNPLLQILLPQIQARMQPNQPWEVRESAILAIGAVAEGCKTGMEVHLQNLVPYLTAQLKDPKVSII